MRKKIAILLLGVAIMLLSVGCVGAVYPLDGETVDPAQCTQMVFEMQAKEESGFGGEGSFPLYRGEQGDWEITEELLFKQHEHFHYNAGSMTVTNVDDDSEKLEIVDAVFTTESVNVGEKYARIRMTVTLPAPLKHGQTYKIEMPADSVSGHDGYSSAAYTTTYFSTIDAPVELAPIAGVALPQEQPKDGGPSGDAPSLGELYRVNASRLNVRAGRGIEFAKLGRLKRGEVVAVDEIQNGWGRIDFFGTCAYVSMDYLEKA